jgi:hypothetical protein
MCLKLFRWKYKKVKDFTKTLPCSCEICGAHFDTMQDLIRHLGLHSTEDINRAIRLGYGVVRCNRCWEAFFTAADMEEHHCSTIIQGLSPVASYDDL